MSGSAEIVSHKKKTNHKKGIRMAAKQLRRKEAEERKVASDKLTVAQRIAQLDMLFGVGKGAAKERARLLNPKPKAKVVAPVPEQQETK